jgi:2-iminobutanoate/2-iminopropanoate deaminase
LSLAAREALAEHRRPLLPDVSLRLRNGSSMERVVKCTVFLADIKEWPAVNEVYREYFKSNFPARSALATSGLAFNARAEVEYIAVATPETSG